MEIGAAVGRWASASLSATLGDRSNQNYSSNDALCFLLQVGYFPPEISLFAG